MCVTGTNSVAGIFQKQTHKGVPICGYQRQEVREAELDEGSQKVQTVSYKIHKC